MSEKDSILTVEVMDSDGSTFTLHEVCCAVSAMQNL